MKKWLGIWLVSLVLGVPGLLSAAELGGGYSFDLPEGWESRDFPGSNYKGAFGPLTPEGFTPNINIQEEAYGGPMETYVKLSLGALEKMMKAVSLGQDQFSAQNAEGVKMVTHTQLNELLLRQTFYFFENSAGQKVVVTATAPRSSNGEFDAVFDQIMHSYKVK